jgi:hypothetical protein
VVRCGEGSLRLREAARNMHCASVGAILLGTNQNSTRTIKLKAKDSATTRSIALLEHSGRKRCQYQSDSCANYKTRMRESGKKWNSYWECGTKAARSLRSLDCRLTRRFGSVMLRSLPGAIRCSGWSLSGTKFMYLRARALILGQTRA